MSPERTHAAVVHTNRIAETVAFLLGVFALSFHMLADTLLHLGYRWGGCASVPVAGIPWGVIVGSALLIAPKVLGRALAGQVILAGIQAITLRLTGRGAATAMVMADKKGGGSEEIARVTVPPEGGSAEITTEAPLTEDEETSRAIAQAGKAREGEE